MERKEGFMKPRLAITAVLTITVVAAALAIAQTAPPKDPDLIDLQGYQVASTHRLILRGT